MGQVNVYHILQTQEQLEVSKRENTGLLERERGLLQQVKSLQNALKNEKEEVISFLEASCLFFSQPDELGSKKICFFVSPCQVHRLQSIIANRASQYNHEMRRKEREFNKLKERLNQLLVDRKDKKQGWKQLFLCGLTITHWHVLETHSSLFSDVCIYVFFFFFLFFYSYWCVKQHWES